MFTLVPQFYSDNCKIQSRFFLFLHFQLPPLRMRKLATIILNLFLGFSPCPCTCSVCSSLPEDVHLHVPLFYSNSALGVSYLPSPPPTPTMWDALLQPVWVSGLCNKSLRFTHSDVGMPGASHCCSISITAPKCGHHCHLAQGPPQHISPFIHLNYVDFLLAWYCKLPSTV